MKKTVNISSKQLFIQSTDDIIYHCLIYDYDGTTHTTAIMQNAPSNGKYVTESIDWLMHYGDACY